MPIILFACKSNSCRSQMAEAWAHQWIHTKLNALNNNEKDREHDSNQDKIFHHNLSLLKNITIASVALDESAVFESTKDDNDCIGGGLESTKTELISHSQSRKRGTTITIDTISSQESSTHRRKRVKKGAINAMAKDGIDITCCKPKTWDDIYCNITNLRNADKLSYPRSVLSDEKGDDDNLACDNHACDNAQIVKPVDKLIILCSCGDNVKQTLVSLSKSVDEWHIDGPSALVLTEKGDPYHRVSLEIKSKVELLLDAMIGRNMKASSF